MARAPAASIQLRFAAVVPTLSLAACLFSLSCTGLNGAYDSDDPAAGSAAGSATSGSRSTDGASPSGDATTRTSAQSGSGTDPEASESTATSEPKTTGASGTAGTEVDPSCTMERFDIVDDVFLVNGPEDISFANYGATVEHALYDGGSPEGNEGNAVMLMRVGPFDVEGVETLHLNVAVRSENLSGGVLYARLLTAFNTCDWTEGTKNGSGDPDGATWAACDPMSQQFWPGDGVLDALGMQIGSISLTALPAPDIEGTSRVEFPFDLEVLDNVPERTVVLYTDGIEGGTLKAQASDTDMELELRPYVWFERCP